jgi:hypothetical protein
MLSAWCPNTKWKTAVLLPARTKLYLSQPPWSQISQPFYLGPQGIIDEFLGLPDVNGTT